MSITKRFWLPYASYDMVNIKNWLEEKAEDGYILKKMKSNFPVFLEVERGSSIKYHLEPTVKDRSKPLEEIIETRKQRGWQYAGTLPDFFHVYYADKSTSEFNHQPEDIAHKLKEKLRSDKKSLLLHLPLSLLVVFTDLLSMNRSDTPSIWFFQNFNWMHMMLLLTFVLSGSFKLISYQKLRNYIKSTDRKEESGTSSSILKLLVFFGNALIGVFLLFFFYQILWGELSQEGAYTAQKQEGYPMKVLQITEDYYNAQDTSSNYGISPYVWTKSSVLLNKQMYASYSSYQDNRHLEFSVQYFRGMTTGIRENFQKEMMEIINKSENVSFSSENADGVVVSYLKSPEEVSSFFAFEEHLIYMRTPMEFWNLEYNLSYLEAFQEELETVGEKNK